MDVRRSLIIKNKGISFIYGCLFFVIAPGVLVLRFIEALSSLQLRVSGFRMCSSLSFFLRLESIFSCSPPCFKTTIYIAHVSPVAVFQGQCSF